MINNKEYSESEWQELASILSEENADNNELLKHFVSGDSHKISEQWKILGRMNKDEINVDKAWDKISSRLRLSGNEAVPRITGNRKMTAAYLKIAASALIIIGLGAAFLFLYDAGPAGRRTVIATDSGQVNIPVQLPDGSTAYLNRNSRLSYAGKPFRSERKVRLSGEAFFEIVPDASKPFTVDAGKARVKVLGTSFNVITRNKDSAVEVFVKTGRVMVADSSGSNSLVLDPGFIGTIGSGAVNKKINDDPNYLSWNTRRLTYDGQKLDVVFRDLKKLYNIEIITSDPGITDLPISASSFNNERDETIIRIICTTFNLTYRKDGNIYHLGKK